MATRKRKERPHLSDKQIREMLKNPVLWLPQLRDEARIRCGLPSVTDASRVIEALRTKCEKA